MSVEIVLVNAGGGEHRALAEDCAVGNVRIVNQGGVRLPRALAANVGLAAAQGEWLKGKLAEMQKRYPVIGHVRGLGLMIGIEIDGSGAEFRKKLLFGKHVFTGGAGASTVRLLPALCLTRELADRFLNAFKELVR